MSACGYAEGCILNDLEFGDIGCGCVREPDWSGVAEKGVYKGLLGCKDSLFLSAPCGASECLQEREHFLGSLHQILYMLVEVEVGV